MVDPLVQTGSCSYRVYSCHSQSFVRTETLADPKIVLVEGAYSAHPYFGAVYDAVYFLSISKQEQKERILRRNGEAMLSRFLDEWIPMEEQYFETFGIRGKGRVMMEGGPNRNVRFGPPFNMAVYFTVIRSYSLVPRPIFSAWMRQSSHPASGVVFTK